jgi:hypothetical protein
MPRPKTIPLEDETPAPTELPPPGPLHCAFRVGEGGGKIRWAQRAYSYTIDPQDDQVVITVALRPTNG